jgi:alkyl hydroperoxide reductase subunit F
MYDCIIIGGGPGGVAAGIYIARKQLKALFLTENFQSQSTVSAGIENWIGDISITGWEFAGRLEKHLRAQEGLEIQTGQLVSQLAQQEDKTFVITTAKGDVFHTKTVIVASGGRHRHLDVPGEEKFKGKGVVYCSTCDAPFFREKKVVVVGGGNAGLEAVEDLLPYAKEIVLFVRGEIKGDQITFEKITASEKVSIVYGVAVEAVLGEEKVEGVKYKNLATGEILELDCEGVFVEIGMVPNTEFVKNILTLNERGEIMVDGRTAGTSVLGVYATGDATDLLYKQNNISAGYGVVAALSAYDYLRKQ